MATGTRRIRVLAALIIILGAAAGAFAGSHLLRGSAAGEILAELPVLRGLFRPYRLGLDLKGGVHLLYRADFTDVKGVSRSEAMAGLREVIERRVNLFGVTEPLVQVETAGGEHRLIVELAGVTAIEEAIRLIGETPYLEFRAPRTEAEIKAIAAARAQGEPTEDALFAPTELTGRYLAQAELLFDPSTNVPLVGVTFTDEGADLFGDMTRRYVGRPIGIYLDGSLLSAPVVQEAIEAGRAQITGSFTIAQARELVRRLNAGALPVPITLVNQTAVGPSLGAESLARSLGAAVAGFTAVAAFMLAWYRLPGLIAVAALSVYAAIVLALFKLIPVTMTAAGIAGFILSIGMAVDANILIFERMREELRRGRELGEAVSEGLARAWTSIRDSNVSSLITASVLYWLGTSVVKGFALTLGLGVLISMFSAITVSRTFLAVIAAPAAARWRWLFVSGFHSR